MTWIIILTTDKNLELLCQSVRWAGDGTLRAAPALWTQLYTIHGQKNGFTVHMWNVLDRVSEGSSRTTNSLESFHHTFNSLLSCQHPSIWKLLDSLQKQQNLTQNIMAKINRGETFRQSSKEQERNARITTLTTNYTRASADALLRGIALNYMVGNWTNFMLIF